MKEIIFPPFLESARETLRTMLAFDSTVSYDNIPEKGKTPELSVLIGLTGDFMGGVFFDIPEKTALSIVENMSGMEISSVDDFVRSAVGEIGNIISGNALSLLSRQGLEMDILPPRFVDGDKDFLPFGQGNEQETAALYTPAGEITVKLNLKTAMGK